LIVIDECHRGSAKEESAWRKVLDYFSSATHIGCTATPVETKEASSQTYFGEPIYEYSLKQGIDDGFLAPYKVIRKEYPNNLLDSLSITVDTCIVSHDILDSLCFTTHSAFAINCLLPIP